ncbi:MAG: helix-turn-helix domain-containing protein [Elusimicrobiota bacterium]|jgi:transcriptional regulator with XRE-family HTH domain|nr:helix-turn-helix domain-containing protein [Elusimicrobiota bacterium]
MKKKIDKTKIKKEIGKRIAFFRNRQRFMQKEVAYKLQMENTSISHWEKGHVSIDIVSLFTLCDILKITILDLVDFSRNYKLENNNIKNSNINSPYATITIPNGTNKTRELTEIEMGILNNIKEMNLKQKTKLLNLSFDILEKKENY